MKRVVLVVILVAIVSVLTGCVNRAETSTKTSIAYAQLIMPDGTIIEGVLTDSLRYSGEWMTVTIDGVKYWTNLWRVVMWEGR